jgi:single-strand DNA-binding protein
MPNPTVVLTGKLIQYPAAAGSGIRLRIATSDRIKNNDTEEWSDGPTSWWTVKAWGKLAEDYKNVLKKGQEITVTGTIYEEVRQEDNIIKSKSYIIKADTLSIGTLLQNKAVD